MRMLLLDDEQAAILADAAETAVRLLNYRVERADPDQIISKSIKLQKLKIDQVKLQLSLPALTGWQDLSPSRQDSVMKTASLLASAVHADHKARLFGALLASIAASREEHATETARRNKAKTTSPDARASEDAK